VDLSDAVVANTCRGSVDKSSRQQLNKHTRRSPGMHLSSGCIRLRILRALKFLVACAVHANAAICSYNFNLPCEIGACTFFKDSAGALSRRGTCNYTDGTVYLSYRGIQSLTAGVFDGLTAVTLLELSGNALTSLPVGVFDGLTAV